MKKFFIKFLTVVALVIITVACVGCKKDEQLQPQPPKAITLDKSSLELILSDSATLNASYDVVDGATLAFTSSDSAVVSVDANGVLLAKDVGSATITASYNGNKATCVVTVVINNILPYVQTVENLSNVITLNKEEPMDFASNVIFNGKVQADGVVSYSVANETIGTLNGSVFTPKAIGETTVTIKGEWRGIDSFALTKTFTVKVINDVEIIINNGYTSEVRLYTVSSHAGNQYKTSAEFNVTVKENGVIKDVTVGILSGEEIVSYDSTAKVIKALTYGKAQMQISFTNSEEVVVTKTVDVIVERPVVEYEEKIELFSAEEGELPLTEIFGKEVELVEAWNGKTQLQIQDNKILNLETRADRATNTHVLLYSTENVGYIVNLEAYKRVINSAQELKETLALEKNKRIEGYYVLGNDIIDNTIDVTNPSAEGYFSGIFDGLGHTLSVKVTGVNGIFGQFGLGSQVKNIAFNDIILEASQGAKGVTLLASRCNETTDSTPLLIENVYISVQDFNSKFDASRTALILSHNWAYLKMTNVIIDMKAPIETEQTNSYGYGLLFVTDPYTGTDSPYDYSLGRYKSVYVITEEKMPMSKFVEKQDLAELAEKNGLNPWKYARFAGNDLSEKERVKVQSVDGMLLGATLAYDGVKRYDSIATMKADASNTYYDFASDYWDITHGVPVWKTLKANIVKVAVDGVEDSKIDLYTVANEELNVKKTVEMSLSANNLGISDCTYSLVSGGSVISLNAETGEITALSVGKAELKATFMYNEVEYTRRLIVNVIDANDLIFAEVNGEISDKTDLYTVPNEKLNFTSSAILSLYKAGYMLENVTYNVTAGEEVVNVDENGAITALSAGEAVVTISYQLDAKNYAKTVSIMVYASDKYIYTMVTKGADMETVDTNAISLVHDVVAGETQNSATLGINSNGFEISSVSYELASGDDFVVFDKATNKVTTKATGVATFTVTFTLAGKEYTKEISITVTPKAEVYEGGALMFSAIDHGAKDNIAETLFGAGEEILVAFDMEGNSVSVENGFITGISVNNDNTVKEIKLQVFTATKGYVVDFLVYTKVIRTIDDFKTLKTSTGNSISGYYILANDIGSAEEYVTGMYNANGSAFKATLDGNGHAVYAQIPAYGLFGVSGAGATIKNIAIYAMDFYASGIATNNRAILFQNGGTGGAPSDSIGTVVIENVYVKVVNAQNDNLSYLSLTGSQEVRAYKIKNVIFDAGNVPVVDKAHNSLIFRYFTENYPGYNDTYQTFENVNIITTRKLISVSSNNVVYFAQNDKTARDNFLGTDETTNYKSYGLTSGSFRAGLFGMYGWTGMDDNATQMQIRVLFRYDNATAMYADAEARCVGNWRVAENGTISWTGNEETPTETPES